MALNSAIRGALSEYANAFLHEFEFDYESNFQMEQLYFALLLWLHIPNSGTGCPITKNDYVWGRVCAPTVTNSETSECGKCVIFHCHSSLALVQVVWMYTHICPVTFASYLILVASINKFFDWGEFFHNECKGDTWPDYPVWCSIQCYSKCAILHKECNFLTYNSWKAI